MCQHGMKLSSRFAGSGASLEEQAKVSCHLCLAWAPSMSYKAIYRWLLLVLGLKVPRRGQAVNQGQLLLVSGLEPLNEIYWASRGQILFV